MPSRRESQPFLAGRTSTDSNDTIGSPTIDLATRRELPLPGKVELDPLDLSKRQRVAILCGLWSATFLSVILSSIASEFKSANQASWLGTSFLLATCTFTPLYGRLSNAAGRRAACQTAVFFCALGTIACGFCTRLELLIAARFLAGLGGGGIFTTASICVSDLYSMRDRSLTQGYASIFVGLGLGLGGPIGGYISDRLGWRWAFLLQAPVFLFSFTLITINLTYATPGRSKSPLQVLKRIDYWGCLTLLCAVASYIIFLSLKYNEDLPFSHPGVIASIISIAVSFIVFIWVELFVAAEPVLAPNLLVQRTPVLVGVSNMIVSICNFSVQFYVPMWFETVQRTSVTVAGLHIMPNSISMSIGSLFAGYMMHRTGRYKSLTTTFGILPMLAAVLLARLQKNSWAITQWLSIIPLGFGNAVVLQSTLIALLASIPRSMLAVGTGFTQLFRGIGQVSGVAVSSAVFQHLLERELQKRLTGPGSEELIRKIRHDSRLVASLPEETQVLAREAYDIGLRAVFLFTAGAAFTGWCLRLAVSRNPSISSF
ncbi:hypothetical protein M407DRAFT_234054 [Tulasnella calospora MUT 4182]|uniref:Major facilitator superfamily (MFS) profile domain-containing protein n=1 Tax=Tulasnella calospora MUT 4182 TaxID=1051891 RepID=A0A0C3QIQ3_9AGAM|nr:hypothetical protein M407DRAFT_234054 [Tulasnella calospora MUT 4182]